MFNHTIVYGITEWALMESDIIIKGIVNKCHSAGVIMQPKMNCHITSLNLLLTPQVMSQYSETFLMFVCESCQGLALKLPALCHSSHFITLQASQPHKYWNRLCQCFLFIYLFIFSGNIVNMVCEAEVSPGHMRAAHESQALGLHFTNKLSLLQTSGKAAPHFFSLHFQ